MAKEIADNPYVITTMEKKDLKNLMFSLRGDISQDAIFVKENIRSYLITGHIITRR